TWILRCSFFSCRFLRCGLFDRSFFRSRLLRRCFFGSFSWRHFYRDFLCFFSYLRCLAFPRHLLFAWFEFKAGFAIFASNQIRFECTTCALRDETWQQICLAFVEQLAHLLR